MITRYMSNNDELKIRKININSMKHIDKLDKAIKLNYLWETSIQ